MSEARLEALGDGRFRLAGVLDVESVPALVERIDELLQAPGDVEVDLGAVSRADSAGLALLVDWYREANRRGRRIHFRQVPPQMLALAQVSGVDRLLALEPRA